MTRPMHWTVEWFVTAIRGFCDGAQMRSQRRPNARQALSLSLLRRLLDRVQLPRSVDAVTAPTA
jgi:hypothetical protein